jgi:hypothetical protein
MMSCLIHRVYTVGLDTELPFQLDKSASSGFASIMHQ